MKIAVIGMYYASNLGDAIICDCVASWLRQAYPDARVDVIDIEGKTDFGSQCKTSRKRLLYQQLRLKVEYWQTRHGIRDKVYELNLVDVAGRKEFYDQVASEQYDAAVFAGGQLFMDWLLVDTCEFLKRLEKTNTPVFFNACGAGLAISENIRKLTEEHLGKSNIKLISSRDDVNKIEERYLSGGKHVHATYDPALWTKEVYQITKAQSNVVGLGVMHLPHESQRKVTAFWIKLIKELDARQIRWKMFCNGAIDDYEFGCYLLKKLGLSIEEHICDYPKKPEELVRQIASFDSLISCRLHSHIIATSLEIPAVAIVWDDKLKFYYRHLQCEERCRTIHDIPAQVLSAWEKAREQGYQQELVCKQKTFAKQLLLDSVEKEVCNEQRQGTC